MEKLTILIVDDDKTTTSILNHMLYAYTDNILTASDGLEGLRLFKEHRPDIILSDINMPHMNGLEMAEAIRKIDEHVKIAIFTDFEKRDILLKAIELGVNQFLSKPFASKSFSKTIQQLHSEVIEKRRVNREVRRQQNILHAINEMSHNFLQQSDWMKALYQEMQNLKEASQMSCIFIYQNEQENNNLSAEKLLYINDNREAKSKKRIHYRKHHFMRWKNKLEKNLSINGNKDDYDKSKTKLLELFKINSLLILPIFVKDQWWGFLGIGDEHKETLEATNVEMLGTAASIIGAAIDNRNNLKSLQMSSAVYEHTMDGVLITDGHNKIVHVNDAFVEITGYTLDDVQGKNPKILKSGKHDRHFYQKIWNQLSLNGYWQGEITNRKKNGEIYIEWLSINAIQNDQGQIENFIGIFSDVTHHRKDADNQAYLATHDPLTGLSNRLLFNDRLEHAINHAERFNKCISIIFCDLDNFKPVNDTYGHTMGDEILKHIGTSLQDILRKDDTVCRFGGDEFVILLEDLESFEYLDEILQRINQLTHTPCVIEGNAISIGMSIGASIYPDDGETPEALIKAADEAMYRAKNSGKNRMEYSRLDSTTYCLKKMESSA
ncbi:MAG TPA: diguanylate cyclase [Sulfurovum sp.]|uniref:diguanylate cyclase domain-containing protein n=1 Tax=Sulfurovum sp. TaxID=1969726 RepID=UPI002F93BC9C